MTDVTEARPNPYVGPRSFETGEALHGRARELRDLLGLLIAERIVLLYSPSGAGKTSLIQAALVPALRAREFTVLPPMRVSLEPPPGAAQGRAGAEPATVRQIPGLNLAAADAHPADTPAGPNRFALSLLLSLEEELPAEQQTPLAELASLTLAEYLDRRGGDADEVLIFDQFEEILTVDPAAQAARAAFFAQVGAALRERRRWALFAAREDYVASLAPYLRPIPTRLSTTFRLDLLSAAGARQAIVEPARAAGVLFDPTAADRLVDDLRRSVVQRPDGTAEELLGPAVEPVQLQVVCRRLWERLPPGARLIGPDEVASAGDVNSALAGYYDERVAAAAASSGVSERALRDWFERQLITPQGIRGQVLRGPRESQGLPNQALPPLLDSYLVRAEKRRGATWYELAHDRLIAPVRASNAAWTAAHLSALQRGAELWEREGRPAGLLLHGEALAEAERWAEAHADELTEAERDFLAAAREARDDAERERRQARRIRRLAIGATALSVLALLALAAALVGFGQAQAQQRAAEHNARIATSRELAAAAVSGLSVDPLRSVLLATAALSVTSEAGEPDVPAALDALQQAVHASRARVLLEGHTKGVQGIAYRPDGARIATSGEDATARVWDAATGDELLVIPNGDTPVLDVAWTPDGARLVAGDLDGAVHVFDAESGDVLLSIPSPGAQANGVDVSPDGARIAAAYDDGSAVVWDIETGEELLRLPHDGTVDDVAFSPDGARIATGGESAMMIWDAETGEQRFTVGCNDDLVVGVAWSPDSGYLASASLDGKVCVWSMRTGERVSELRGHSSSVNAVAWSPDGTYLATGGADGTARLWEPIGGAQLLTLAGHEDWVTRLAWSPDGTRLATASLDDTARVWDVGLVPPDGVLAVDFSPDDTRLASGGTREARVWDAAGGERLALLGTYPSDVNSLRFSPDGARIAVASIESASALPVPWGATVQDAASGATLRTLQAEVQGGVNRVAWRSDGAQLATAGDDTKVRVWDAESGDLLHELEGHDDWVVALAWSPDGARLATGDRAGLTIVWDAESGDLLQQIPRDDGAEINSLAWSPDGKLLALAVTDGRAHIVDATSGAEVRALAHQPDVRDAAWSPDGTRIATAGGDKTLRLWDAATGAELRAFTLAAEPYELAWSHEGTRIAVAAADGIPRIFELERAALLRLAQARAIRPPTAQECAAYRLTSPACRPSSEAQSVRAHSAKRERIGARSRATTPAQPF